MERGMTTERILGIMTRPQLMIYSYLKEKEKFRAAVKSLAKGGVLSSQIILPGDQAWIK
jgi:hypothetical protein